MDIQEYLAALLRGGAPDPNAGAPLPPASAGSPDPESGVLPVNNPQVPPVPAPSGAPPATPPIAPIPMLKTGGIAGGIAGGLQGAMQVPGVREAMQKLLTSGKGGVPPAPG